MGSELNQSGAIMGKLPADQWDTAQHPCYSCSAQHQYARMHLPVAPECNISCNYCNRRFDCVNESRPGVTSEVLTPEAACEKLLRVRREMPNLTVAGIAGPGDALANWDRVKQTLTLIRREAPELMFCLSTNGLMLPRYGPELVALGVRHVTVTVNCLNPVIGARIYHHVVYEGQYITRERGAELLIQNQLAGIEWLAGQGVLVKVNIVMIPGINTSHLLEVVKKVKGLGARLTNIMPLIPAPGSVFESWPQTRGKELEAVRSICESDITQMRHCQQCRADAIGLLAEDQSYRFRQDSAATDGEAKPGSGSYRVAVTSKYRKLVDLHYGHAEEFHIYRVEGGENRFLETRRTVKYCGGADCDPALDAKEQTIAALRDCDAVLTMRIGNEAQKRLQAAGIRCIESCDTVEGGLQQAYQQLERESA